ncbi:MAG: hypothetical protein AAFQ84_10265 [Pseudomonadota bacterium]
MKTAFREAFIARMSAGDVRVADLVRETGVSRSKIEKLLKRSNDRVEVEDAISVAAFFGQTVEEFMFGSVESPKAALVALASLLTDAEAEILVSQLKGLVAAKGTSRKQPSKS